jgi:hypothetical protein
MDYEHFLATVVVDVVSRHATRRVLINGDRKQLVWDWDMNCLKLFNPKTSEWEAIPYQMQPAAAGYHANIGENMYIDEVRNFLQALRGNGTFINTLENDWRVLKLLYAIEESDRTSKYVSFMP